MPLRSMTGFGSAARAWTSAEGPVRVEVEMRSVNARFLEVKLKQPSGRRIEQARRRRVEGRLGRGRVGVAVHLRRETGAGEGTDVLTAFGFDEGRIRGAMQL